MIPNSLIGPAPSLALASVADFSLNIWSGYQPAYNTALAAMHAGLDHPGRDAGGADPRAPGTTGTMISRRLHPGRRRDLPGQ